MRRVMLEKTNKISRGYFYVAIVLLVFCVNIAILLAQHHSLIPASIYIFGWSISAKIISPVVYSTTLAVIVSGFIVNEMKPTSHMLVGLLPIPIILLVSYGAFYTPEYTGYGWMSKRHTQPPLERMEFFGPRDEAKRAISPFFVTIYKKIGDRTEYSECPYRLVEKAGPFYTSKSYDFEPDRSSLSYPSRFEIERGKKLGTDEERAEKCKSMMKSIMSQHDWVKLDDATFKKWNDADYISDYNKNSSFKTDLWNLYYVKP